MLNPIGVWIQPDVSDSVVWCHLVYATSLYLFTQNVRMKIVLNPIGVWIQPDVSDPAVLCHLVYVTFLHLFTPKVR